MQKIFPFLGWLGSYRKRDFLKDLVAGLTVAVVLIPQGMAYAMIAGLPPVYGLYASIVPILLYAVLGTSRQVAMGPVAMDSLLVAAGLGTLAITGVENYIAMALVLAFLVGAIQLLLGISRMGFLVRFLSRPVISGFTSGAALIIIFSQLKHLMGTDVQESQFFHQQVVNAFQSLGDINYYDFTLGVVGIVLIVLFRKWDKRIPGVLIVVLLGILSAYVFDLEAHGLHIVGVVPEGLPAFQVPNIDLGNIKSLWPIAITLALVGYLETISIGKAIEEKNSTDHIDPNQELVALGVSNIVGSFFQSYISTASFSRSAINNDSGARTHLSSIFSVVLVVLTLLFLTPLFYYLPKAVLASIIMVSVFGLINIIYPRGLWQQSRGELVVLMATLAATLFIGLPQGILIGVLFSLLLMVYKTSNPHFAVLGNIRNSDYYKNVKRFGDEVVLRDDLLIIRFDAQLYFGNSDYFKNELLRQINLKGKSLKAVILNAEAITYIDSTGANILSRVIDTIHNRGLQFYIAGAIGPTRDTIYQSGIINSLEKEYLFVKTKEAVAYYDDPKTISEIQDKVAHQNSSRVTKVIS
ncbi:SulP family inorganic anion transporter [Aggregatimonas sangjinii]|uniref:SulP family inorganic anion transporter n=1 Tax=Aggregatimonas sangjinii TaxID=2583587 RepID=A0A5B7SVU3_9FLAO|nr:SulP family inorganic anion transporter [Aggregatimonas sangjinii]QCX00950.1 SulP family inorganic anion transporter [Aggregatimonas sangjinii]